MKKLRASVRGILLIVYLIGHIAWIIIPAIFRGTKLDHALRIRQLCAARLLRMLGVKVDKHGAPPPGHHIFVGNHRSYIDPIVAMMDVPALPVTKADVADWPVIGYGAKVTGTMFVKRDSKQSRSATLDAMRETLKMGYSILVYPEGTTHLEPTTIDFRTGAFNMAAKDGFSVVPMAIDYLDLGDAWVGDDTFVTHFLRCFGKRRTYVKFRYGKPLVSDKIDFLVTESKQWINENMLAIRQEFDSEKTSSAYPAFAG